MHYHPAPLQLYTDHILIRRDRALPDRERTLPNRAGCSPTRREGQCRQPTNASPVHNTPVLWPEAMQRTEDPNTPAHYLPRE